MIIEDRVMYLEKELNRIKRRNSRLLTGIGFCLITLAAILGFFSIPTAAQASRRETKQIRANNFILEDKDGRKRAELAMDEDGPMFRLNNENGSMSVALYIHDRDKAGLSLFDANGNVRASVSLVQNVPLVFLYDESGNARAQLFFSNQTGPGIKLYDEKHNLLPIR
jgi:hypothetical protein